MQADLGFHFDDADGDLDEAQTQGVKLGGSEAVNAWAWRRATPTSTSTLRRAGRGETGSPSLVCMRYGRQQPPPDRRMTDKPQTPDLTITPVRGSYGLANLLITAADV